MFRKDECGVAAVEFALVVPVLATLLLGMADGALLFLAKMDMEHSVKAGAVYTASNSSNVAAIKSAISGATGRPVTATVGAEYCMCPDGTAAACSATCSITGVDDDIAPGRFIDLTASTTYQTFLPWPGLTTGENMATLSAKTTVRIQ